MAANGSLSDDRRAHLTAAATAVIGWVHQRRATWSDPSAGMAPPPVAARPPIAPPPPPVVPPVQQDFVPSPEFAPLPMVEPTPFEPEPVPLDDLAADPEAAQFLTGETEEFAQEFAAAPYAQPAADQSAFDQSVFEQSGADWPAFEPSAPAEPEIAESPEAATSELQDLVEMLRQPQQLEEVEAIPEPPAEPGTPLSERVATVVREHGPLALKWSIRVGLAAALIVVLVVGARTGQTYWSQLSKSWAKAHAVPKTGTALFDSVPPGAQVIVDDVAMGTTPLKAELAPGRRVVVFRYKGATRAAEIVVVAGQSTSQSVDWSRKPTGTLQVTSDPAGARILVDGKPRGVTPTTLDDLPPGSHTVVLESPKGTIRRTVDIASGRTTELAESIYPAWVRVYSPVELEISEGSRVLRQDDQNQVLLSPGLHELRFRNRRLGLQEVRQVELTSGQVATLSIVPSPSTISVTSNVAADVWIDGEHIGATPLTNHGINLGSRDVVVKTAAGEERRFTLNVTVKPVQLDVDFSQPAR